MAKMKWDNGFLSSSCSRKTWSQTVLHSDVHTQINESHLEKKKKRNSLKQYESNRQTFAQLIDHFQTNPTILKMFESLV